MIEYPKIQSIFKRDEHAHKFIEGEWALPEFEFLAMNDWEFTEKVDGTNVRVEWSGEKILFGGRTDNAQTPTFLLARLQELFSAEKFNSLYPETPMILFGEGYGARIQKGGGNYKSDGVDFMLFDVLCGGLWLRRADMLNIAEFLHIGHSYVVGCGTIPCAIELVKGGMKSAFGDFVAEGLVIRPVVELQTRRGHRVISKLKTKDF